MKTKLRANMRTKKRYLMIEGCDEDKMKKIILDYIGVLGWARASPVFVKKNKNGIVLAINREEIDNIRAAFAASGEKIAVSKISGTLKGLDK